MDLNLNDPQSIVTWHAVRPEVHGDQLSAFASMSPQYRWAIGIARQMIDDREDALASRFRADAQASRFPMPAPSLPR